MKYYLVHIHMLIFFLLSGNACKSVIRTHRYDYEKLVYSLNRQERKILNLYLEALHNIRDNKKLIVAIKEIGRLGDNKARIVLKNFYRNGNKAVRKEIRKSINIIYNRGRSLYILHNLIKNKDSKKKIIGMQRLVKYFDKNDKIAYENIIPEIKKICISDFDDLSSVEAINFIGSFKIEDSVDFLVNILLDNNRRVTVRKAISDALISIGKPSLPRLIEVYSRDDKKWIEKIILDIGEPAVPYLANLFYTADDILRVKIINLLRIMKEDFADRVLADLLNYKNQPPSIKCKIIKALGRPAKNVTSLVNIVKSNDFKLYKGCLKYAFVMIKWQAVSPLNNLLRNISDREIKIFLIELLGKLRVPASVDNLKYNFDQDDIEMSKAVVKSLLQINDASAKEIYIKIISENITELTDMAIEGLARLGTKILPDLKALLKNSRDDTIALNVLKILGKKGNPDFYDLIMNIFLYHNKDNRIIYQAIKYFGKFNIKKAEQHIIPFLDHDDPDIRLAAVEALGILKSEMSINKIIYMMKDEELSYGRDITNKPIDALMNIGPKAVPYLLKALKNENHRIREYSAWVLGNICNKQCIEPIREMLSREDDPEVFVYVMKDNFPSLTKVPVAYEALRLLEKN